MEPNKICLCGAGNQPNANYCWLCGAKFSSSLTPPSNTSPPILTKNVQTPPVTAQNGTGISIVALVFLFFSLAVVLIGVFLYLPGAGVLLTFICLPMVIMLAIRAKQYQSQPAIESQPAYLQSGLNSCQVSQSSDRLVGVSGILKSVIIALATTSLLVMAIVGAIFVYLLSICSAILSNP